MALNTSGLKSELLQIFEDMEEKETDSKEEFATRLSNAFETFVKSGTVTVASGIQVSTTGTAAAQTGATTTTGTGSIS